MHEPRNNHYSLLSLAFRTLLLALLLSAWSATAHAQTKTAPRRLAALRLSDGQVLQGTVLLTPGINFALTALPHSGQKFTQTRTFNVDIVKEMSFAPFTLSTEVEPERLMQPFKWDSVDRYKRIPQGPPYPVRELSCAVKFTNGQELTGVLASVVLYLQPIEDDSGFPGETRKFILKSKQVGEPKQTLAKLIYITHIRMLDEGVKVAPKFDVELLTCKLGPGDELSAITRDSLEFVATKPTGKSGRYEVSSTFGENIFLAARKGNKYIVGWPEEGTRKTKLYESVEQHVRDLRDYFNERRLLGILPNDSGTQVLTLVSLRRRIPANAYKGEDAGEFDADGKPMEFFRVSILLWKRDTATGKMILAKRGSFFRVRVDAGGHTPQVEITPELWPIVLQDSRVTVGKAR